MCFFNAFWYSVASLSFLSQGVLSLGIWVPLEGNRSLQLQGAHPGQLGSHSALLLSTSSARKVTADAGKVQHLPVLSWGEGATLVSSFLSSASKHISIHFDKMPDSPVKQAPPPLILSCSWISTQLCTLQVPFFLSCGGGRSGWVRFTDALGFAAPTEVLSTHFQMHRCLRTS